MTNAELAIVVDGHAPDRVNTAKTLEAAGYRVRSAESFDEAKAVLEAERPAVLITELRLGPYNGLHLVLRSRSAYPEIGAVVTSRVADPVLEAETRRQEAQFVLQPATDAQLLDAVNACLAQARSRVAANARRLPGLAESGPIW